MSHWRGRKIPADGVISPMDLYKLPDDLISQLLSQPETGMGYQLIQIRSNAGLTFEGAANSVGIFSPTVNPLIQGVHRSAPDFSKGLALNPPLPKALPPHLVFNPRLMFQTQPKQAAAEPPHEGVTDANDVFFRFSAYLVDWRITKEKALLPGSYSTTDTDVKVVPNGLAAVGRYAMPSRISARYVFKITPGAGVKIRYGTVTPNFGLAGGGVEVFFPDGTPPNTAEFSHSIPEK